MRLIRIKNLLLDRGEPGTFLLGALLRLGLLMVLLFIAFAVFILPTSMRIRSFDKVYYPCEKGTHKSEIIAELGPPTQTYQIIESKWWDDEISPDADREPASETLEYVCPTWYIWIIYTFDIDASGRVVGKHRAD